MMSVDYSSGSTKLTIKNKIGLHTSRKAKVEGTSTPEYLEKKKKKNSGSRQDFCFIMRAKFEG